MDKVGEFITGLQTILDSPNLPRDDLVRVIQSTQREFLFNALAISTLSWPTRTHLELVKIVISMPIPEPSPDAVMADPTTSHEADPFFAAEYFDKLRNQLLQMSVQQLADLDGSWVRNIGFSVEATVMQACRRADALEKLEELTKSDNGQLGPDYGRVRIYCAHVLGSGTLALRHWEAVARMVFTMFHVLPFTTKTLAGNGQLSDDQEDRMHPFVPRLVANYSVWLQIVMQMIETHGQALCRRMPTVIEDPVTKQFRGGNSGSDSDGSVSWSSSIELTSAEEGRLEQFEQSILGSIIARDASAVYGMMSEHHHLLQMFEEYMKNLDPIDTIPGTVECLNLSLTHTCYGLAPILGFEELALTQAMDMRKMLECLGDMKTMSLQTCYLPLYGCYPQNTGLIPAYAELLLLRISTTLFNIDRQWGDIVMSLTPIKISGTTKQLCAKLTRSLRNLAVYFDTFSLCTTVSATNGPSSTGESVILGSISQRLMTYQFIRHSNTDCIVDILANDLRSPVTTLDLSKVIDISTQWICDFVELACSFILGAESAKVLDSNCWQLTLALCCPESTMLAYVTMVQCIDAARNLVRVSSAGGKGGADKYVVTLKQEGVSILHSLERILTVNGAREWAANRLLFTPQMYETKHADNKPVEQLAQSHFADAVKFLSTTTQCEWAGRVGIQGALLEFSEEDMRMVARFISHYVESAPNLFSMLPRLLTGDSSGQKKSGQSADCGNPFKVPYITLKPAPIESQHNPNACNIKAAVLQWRRNIASLPFSESRKHIQELVSECYPSNSKHYLEQVIVRFMEEEPVVGVELVIGSIADHMFKKQIVYTRRASPFYAIRNMFTPVGPPEAALSDKHALSEENAKRLAQPKGEPVFNAVVGGKVRQHTYLRHGAILQNQQAPSTTERARISDRLIQSEIGSGLGPSSPMSKRSLGYDIDDEHQETVQSPTTCHRILLLLTDLCYGNSLRDTPIHMWLTDNMDIAPQQVLKKYFGFLLKMEAPNFSEDLPLEPDWPKKVAATMSLWTTDSRLVVRPFVHMAAASIMQHVLEDNGEQWSERWAKWAPTVTKVIGDMFTRPTTSALQAAIVDAMLSVPLPAAGRDIKLGQFAVLQKHPLSILFNILTPESVIEQVSFADKRDWFIVHVQPRIIDTMAENPAAKDIFGAVLSSPACLYRIVPWFDIATSLVQNVPLSHGCPVTMRPAIAKRNFVSYLSPLARVLIAIAMHADGDSVPVDYSGADEDEDDGGEEQSIAGRAKTESPQTLDSPFDGSSREDNHEDESEFSWQWMDELLVLYLSSSSSNANANDKPGDNISDLDDTIDALLDVYTYSSMRGLRRSIENVITANCLHDKDIMEAVLCRMFSKRPLDVYTLHSLRPRQLTQAAAPPTPHSATTENDSSFRPGAEIYPLARRVLQIALGPGSGSGSALGAKKVAQLIGQCMWSTSEEPDVRRNLIALKPRLIPKEQRPAANETNMSQDTILQTTSGSLHIPAEAIASAAAYALDRCVCLLGILVAQEGSDALIQDLAVQLSHSRIFMATLMTTIGDSMRQFATLSATRELLNALWKASSDGEAIVSGLKISQVWLGINFHALAQRLNSQAPDEYTTWGFIQSLPAR
ncbi:hypothetical protein H4217_004440 [Coemansia sp. RSA 1939]|nr:hypothetical protein H4217_004440 [Coemansia sp. RSA 1939]